MNNDQSLANLFANTVNASQNVEGPNAMNDDDAYDIITALRNNGIIVAFFES